MKNKRKKKLNVEIYFLRITTVININELDNGIKNIRLCGKLYYQLTN